MKDLSEPKTIFTLKISAAFLVFIALTWSWLYQPFLLPFHFLTILKIPLSAGLIVLLIHLYREFKFEININRTNIWAAIAYLVSGLLLTLPWLSESITGDELYNAERAVNYINSLSHIPFFQNIPIPELNFYISLGLIVILTTFYWFYRRIKTITRPGYRYTLLFIIITFFGLLCSGLNIQPESHPPLRLLPLFISQLVFGLQDFSFRLPSLIGALLISFFCYRLILFKTGRHIFSWAAGLAVFMIPTVFHSSAIVEPSVWGYMAAVITFFCLYYAKEENNHEYFIWAGLAIGIGSLFRQNAIILWPVLLVFLFIRKKFDKTTFLSLLPSLFIAPYLISIALMGHPAFDIHKLGISASCVLKQPNLETCGITDSTSTPTGKATVLEKIPPLRNIYNSITTGLGPKTIIKSSTLPWIIFLIFAGAWVLLFSKTKLKPFFILFLSGYFMFFALAPGLWGLGRYQTEFIAPIIVFSILILAIEFPDKHRPALVAMFFLLSSYSLFANITIPQDIHYDRWPRKKISTESHFPYKQALGFLQRQDSDGKFIIVGGIPFWGDLHLWLRGFTFHEINNYNSIRQSYVKFILNDNGLENFYKLLETEKVNYFMVQYGDKREIQHRNPTVTKLLLELSASGDTNKTYKLLHTFIDPMEGAIDIYARNNLRY